MVKPFFTRIFKSSFLWGGLATFGFYSLIHNGLLKHPLVIRYTAMHPVEYVITGMFFIGLAGLIVKIFCVRI
ncbi:MAG: hypothetical protein LBQ54_03915, partial [Planctomycetaceae bacterium]|nr:hypothetical protein [Planctomycetaceae bacterium]